MTSLDSQLFKKGTWPPNVHSLGKGGILNHTTTSDKGMGGNKQGKTSLEGRTMETNGKRLLPETLSNNLLLYGGRKPSRIPSAVTDQ